ncbi:SIMPL domain-containing protein [Onishia niordana]|uniref:SIMPL domain-containing protein n=1 Tax=Onishia niordana TaxID=2508711 RepID=UPI00197A9103|nr:SIMPL domain-containing protein [Halomonas niordiana]
MTMGRIMGALILGGLLMLGLVWGGSYIRAAAQVWKQADRVVTVKGLAEREVPADLALWPLHFSVTGDRLGPLQAEMAASEERIRDFLIAQGFDAGNISVTPPNVRDLQAESYGQPPPEERYRGEATVLLRTPKVARVKAAMPKTGTLVGNGVLLSPNYEYRIEFLFTGLEAIKPEMIADATQDARRAAEQFANDAGSAVGHIRSASQGYFSINDLDSYTPDIKRVRVVTTIDYALDD